MIRAAVRHRRLLLAGGVIVMACAALIVTLVAVTTSGSQQWRLAWVSDFSGQAGTVPAGWNFENGGSGWGNNEQEYYVDRAQDAATQNAALDGHGDLAITVRRNTDPALKCSYDTAGSYSANGTVCLYTSARLDTSTIPAADHAYERIEARIKLPAGAGIWPAFWALGSDFPSVSWPACGEIDVMENFGSTPGTVAAHLHGPMAVDRSAQWQQPPTFFASAYTLPGGAAFSSAFHTFAVDWYPDHISFSVDGHVYETIDKASLPSDNAWVFDKPFYLLLNVAVGSAHSPGGAPDSSTTFPQTMLVKWIRVYAAPS
jgi:beta-glucanase (GH16 family)